MKKTTLLFLAISTIVCSFCAFYAHKKYLDAGNIIVNEYNTDILTKYDIISDDDLAKNGNITLREAFTVFLHLNGYYPEDDDKVSSNWYSHPSFEPLDGIPENDKILLYNLYAGPRNSILRSDEIPSVDLNADLTYEKALLYTIRLIGDTYGCTDYAEELDYTETAQIYDKAFEKGLISQNNTAAAEQKISRHDFYTLVSAAAALETNVGSYSPYITSLETVLENRAAEKDEESEEPEVPVEKLDADVRINDDMSISWILNDSGISEVTDDWWLKIEVYDINGEITGSSYSHYYDSGENFISVKNLLLYIIGNSAADHITVTYSRFDRVTFTTREIKSFDIDISNIKTVTEGEPLKPAVFQTFKNKWVPYKISLDGEKLKKGSYYILTSYSHEYRLPELNSKHRAVFSVKEDTDAYTDETCNYQLLSGSIETRFDDIHISKADITGDPVTGFTVHITPESEAFAEYPDH